MIQFWIDTETTGTDYNKDSIIQLALVVRVDGKETERHDWKIKPYRKTKIDSGAIAAHGITQEMADNFPDQEIAFKEFMEITDKYKLGTENRAYFCGFNSNFDLQMVKGWYETNSRYNLFSQMFTPDMDVMRYAIFPFAIKGVRNYMPNFKLSTVYETLFNRRIENAHDAMADIDATIEIYDALMEKYFPETLVTE